MADSYLVATRTRLEVEVTQIKLFNTERAKEEDGLAQVADVARSKVEAEPTPQTAGTGLGLHTSSHHLRR